MSEDVMLLLWPQARAQGEALVAAGSGCVWLVPVGAAPPTEWSDLEDWVRLPSDRDELAARVAGVSARVGARRQEPRIDEHDLLWVDDRWVALSAMEARMARCLVEQLRRVVRRDDLAHAAWPGSDGAHDLNAAVKTLRRKLTAVGVSVHAVSRRGYVAEVISSSRCGVGPVRPPDAGHDPPRATRPPAAAPSRAPRSVVDVEG